MGGVVVLNPQDCLKQQFSHKGLISSPPHTKQPRNPNPNPNPNPSRANHRAQPNRRSRRAGASAATVQKSPANKLVMSNVKILKRGEKLAETTPDPPSPNPADKENLSDPASPPRFRPDPESDRVAGFYAGSSMCIVSPPPSSLPLPAFFSKKSIASTNVEATNALLSVLRLDL
ncbi:hypothetical protein TIFTF001_014688 [Ficus carica]|uniref:Uncharacterized protein n=1 Tax=Ficus carica TaxID=3494 RepID=A0AA88A4D5_FICCA|nr:hypothetical protein TIFTF001_014688 [Ficus carica]